MRIQLPFALLFAAVFICSMHAAPAQAQRVFVSASGSDSNPCTFASPCRSFQHAHDSVAANGEIDVLDPAGYGTLTISKAISIQGHGYSGISVASGGTGIFINAPPMAAVSLNGLLIDGAGVGQTGIAFQGGLSLTVENCIVRNVISYGMNFASFATTAETLSISNSYFNDSAGGIGVIILTEASGAVTASIDRTVFSGNLKGLVVEGNFGTGALTVAATDSVAANNLVGFQVFAAPTQSITNLSLTHSTAVGNSYGVVANGTNGMIWLAQSTVTGNTTAGYDANNGGVIMSYGDNYLSAANGPPIGSLTSATKQ
jgi:hypothetical protein